MACNCKDKRNNLLAREGFGENDLQKASKLMKVGNVFVQFIFGLIVSVIILIGLIPACLYIVICVCTGKEMVARIPDFSKWLKKKE